MPRVGLTTTIVTEEAGRLADEVGFENLTLSALALRLGVRQPTLYKHVKGTAGLHREMSVLAKKELADVMRRAAVGRARGQALSAIFDAYRAWANEHPGRYVATVRAPAPGDLQDEHAALEALTVVTDVLEGYGLSGDDAIDATRALRATLHGFVTLQSAGAFGLPTDIDRSFHRMVKGVIGAIAQWNITIQEDAENDN
jgi:AcrR family transcriptional regulator